MNLKFIPYIPATIVGPAANATQAEILRTSSFWRTCTWAKSAWSAEVKRESIPDACSQARSKLSRVSRKKVLALQVSVSKFQRPISVKGSLEAQLHVGIRLFHA